MYSKDELKTLGETFDFRFEDVSRTNSSAISTPSPSLPDCFWRQPLHLPKEPENVDPTKPFPDDEVLRQAAEEFQKEQPDAGRFCLTALLPTGWWLSLAGENARWNPGR